MHIMKQLTELPKNRRYAKSYPDTDVYCDADGCGVLANGATSFYHCGKCFYDLCLSCGQNVTA